MTQCALYTSQSSDIQPLTGAGVQPVSLDPASPGPENWKSVSAAVVDTVISQQFPDLLPRLAEASIPVILVLAEGEILPQPKPGSWICASLSRPLAQQPLLSAFSLARQHSLMRSSLEYREALHSRFRVLADLVNRGSCPESILPQILYAATEGIPGLYAGITEDGETKWIMTTVPLEASRAIDKTGKSSFPLHEIRKTIHFFTDSGEPLNPLLAAHTSEIAHLINGALKRSRPDFTNDGNLTRTRQEFGYFTSAVFHEFAQPINSLRLLAAGMMGRETAGSPGHEFACKIEERVGRLEKDLSEIRENYPREPKPLAGTLVNVSDDTDESIQAWIAEGLSGTAEWIATNLSKKAPLSWSVQGGTAILEFPLKEGIIIPRKPLEAFSGWGSCKTPVWIHQFFSHLRLSGITTQVLSDGVNCNFMIQLFKKESRT